MVVVVVGGCCVGGFVVLCTSQNYTSAWFIFSSVAGGFVISTSHENQQAASKNFELSQDAGCLDNIGTTALRITRPLNCTTNLGKMDLGYQHTHKQAALHTRLVAPTFAFPCYLLHRQCA